MIKERYCSYEVARLLKEKGFDEDTVFVWYEHLPKANAACREDVGKPKMEYFYLDETSERDFKFHNFASIPPYINGEVYSAPTHQMACDWLGDIHDLHIIAYPYKRGNNKGWCCYVYKTYNLLGQERYIDETCNSCYEAIEAALKYSLKNLI